MLYRGSNCSPSLAMDGRIMRHGIISSRQSAATSEIVKRCCSSLVSSAITSTPDIYLLQPLMSAVTVHRTLRIPHVLRQRVPDSRASNRKRSTSVATEPVSWYTQTSRLLACQMRGGRFFRRFSTNMSPSQKRAFYTQSYYRTVIGNHIQAIEWCHIRCLE